VAVVGLGVEKKDFFPMLDEQEVELSGTGEEGMARGEEDKCPRADERLKLVAKSLRVPRCIKANLFFRGTTPRQVETQVLLPIIVLVVSLESTVAVWLVCLGQLSSSPLSISPIVCHT